MKSIFDLVNDEGEIMGPGTDLVISLVALLVLLLALHYANSNQKLDVLEEMLEINEDTSEQNSDYHEKIMELQDYLNSERNNSFQDSIKASRRIKNLQDSLDASRRLFKDQDLILKEIRKSQLEIIEEVAHRYKVSPLKVNAKQYNIPVLLNGVTSDTIRIENDATLQRISFGNAVLFDTDRAIIKSKGKKILYNICSVFKKKLHLIKEIQIQGHASADSKSLNYSSLREHNDNLDLAGRRAISIVRYFRNERKLKLSPAQHIIYASAFGYYMPVERDYSDSNWNLQRIADSNKKNQRQKNKRIEIVLNYKEVRESINE